MPSCSPPKTCFSTSKDRASRRTSLLSGACSDRSRAWLQRARQTPLPGSRSPPYSGTYAPAGTADSWRRDDLFPLLLVVPKVPILSPFRRFIALSCWHGGKRERGNAAGQQFRGSNHPANHPRAQYGPNCRSGSRRMEPPAAGTQAPALQDLRRREVHRALPVLIRISHP